MSEIGVFETIAIENGKAVFLERHLERMKKAMKKLKMNNEEFEIKVNVKSIYKFLLENPMSHGVLKITVAADDVEFSKRDNQYLPEDYIRGYFVDYAKTIRDESSIFTYIKSTNNSENLLEKSQGKERGIDEPIFLNSKGELTEGAVTNIFFVKEGKLFTPKIECGLLEGTIRAYIIENYQVCETIILPEEIKQFEEMFLTNSLMGIMPVKRFGDHVFKSNLVSKQISL